MSSKSLSEQTLNDLSLNFIRPRLTTIQGAAIPYPYGGKQRQVQVDIDIPKLQARGLTPNDVVNAISAENLILPSGTAKIGPLEYDITMNGSVEAVNDLNNLPIKTVNGAIIYVRDVANVRDGFSPQTNIVRQDGVRSTLLSVLKNGDVSTLDIVGNVKALIPKLKPTLPPDLDIRALFDQSIFVRASISGVIREGRDRGVPHGADDPALPRRLEKHDDHRALHPALGAQLHPHPQRAGRDDQHHDPRRPRAGGRHPGR